MRKQRVCVLALVVLALAGAGEASAAVQRTFVSGLGSDANACSRTAPCRTFAAAIAQTLPGGEVLALDTAGYGPVTIDKAISLISPPGVYAGITTTVAATDAVTVAAGSGDVVVLKGLSLSGLGVGGEGVRFQTGRALRVEGLTISGFTGDGIHFVPSASARLTVLDSLIRDNDVGLFATAPESALARVAIDGTRLIGNYAGVYATENTRVSVRDSTASGSTGEGFFVFVSGVLDIENCAAVDNGFGIYAYGGLARVAGTTVTENQLGIFADSGLGASILSRGNNTVEGNTSNGTFTGAFAAK